MTSEILSKLIEEAVSQAFSDNQAVLTKEIMSCFHEEKSLDVAVAKAIPVSMKLTARITTMLVIRTLEHQGVIQLPADGEPILRPLF